MNARGLLLPTLIAAVVALAACTGPAAGVTSQPAPGVPHTAPDTSVLGSTALDNTALDTTALEETAPEGKAPATSTTTDAAEPVLTSSAVPLAAGVADEASGIVASSTTPGAYFLIDDGTGTDSIAAVGSDGTLIVRIAVDGMSADNAEALSAGPCGPIPIPDDRQPENCLYIGDIGDNNRRRDDITVVRIAEPTLAVPPADPVPADEWRYTYPDGAHNAEAMMVDSDGSLIIVTKPPAANALQHRMYRAEPGGGDLVFLREFSPPAAGRPFKTLFTGNVVTDLAAASGRVLLLTYDDVQEYRAPDPAAELSTFPDWPHRPLPMPAAPQAEGITVAADGCGYTVASEAGPAGGTGWLGIVTCR